MGKVVAGGLALIGGPIAVVVLVVVAVVGVAGADGSSACSGPGSGTGLAGTSILGVPSVTAAQLAAWYSKSGYSDPESTIGVSLAQLTADYVLAGSAEGVRPEVAFVQAVVETGGFTNRDARQLNNFAGIGHCDTCAEGMSFPSVAVGVLAQVQLLKKVVLGNDAPMSQPDVAPPWGGRQASTLTGLAGNWASSPIYATVLGSTLASLLASAGFGLGPGTTPHCASNGSALPVPAASIRAESWLTKPHHDYPAADVPVPAGTDVFAPVSGTVTAAPVGGACGLGVSIRDVAGNTWILCHGADGGQLVHRGDKVDAGDLVMHSGFTGHVVPAGPAGAHLHVQIRLSSGGLVCPQNWLDALWRGSPPPDVTSLPSTGCVD